MKKFGLLLIVFLTFFSTSHSQDGSGIFFSEYFEGASYNKAIEIYNGNNAGINLPLSRFRVRLYSNGAATPSVTFPLSVAEDGITSTLNWNSTFTIYHGSFVDPNTNLPNAPTSGRVTSSSLANFNGDDALDLQFDLDGLGNWVTVDVFGQIGVDPGVEWGTSGTSTLDNGLIRKSSINTGRSDGVFVPGDHFDPASGSLTIKTIALPVTTFGQHTIDNPLPVELSSFSATTIGSTIKLSWQTATEINNFGFEVERKSNVNGQTSEGWTKLGFVNGNGNSNSPKNYSFVDDNVTAGTYSYRLKQIDNDGRFEYSKAIEIGLTAPDKFELSQNYPNPFNPSTTISYNLPEATNVKLIIFNILGQEVKTLINGFKEAGVHSVNFNASELNSGLYIYKIEAGSFTQTRKMTLIK